MNANRDTLKALLERYYGGGKPPEVQRVRFDDALRRGDDPLGALQRLAGLGVVARSLYDLLLVNDDDEEEPGDIFCFRVVEGVAAVKTSADVWVLFEG